MSKKQSIEAAASGEPREGLGDWGPPQVREDGVHLGPGGLPFNHRLRAEALAAAGKTRDPDAIVSEELIADTRKRLAAEAKAEAQAEAQPAAEQE